MSDPATHFRPSSVFVTHEVTNQPPPLVGYNAWTLDRPARDALKREGGDWAGAELEEYGELVGGEMVELGDLANRNKPILRSFDRYGHRIDEVEFHPSWHRIMELGVTHGVVNFAWNRADRVGAHVARAGLGYLHHQAEQGSSCPLTMSYACVPALRHSPDLAAAWVPKLLSGVYDFGLRPLEKKKGVLFGMGMTEKQGGSDVRSNTTRALPMPDGSYELVGHKWFFSAPMCDAFLVLAYTDGGIGCFLLPRVRPDGSRNAIRIQRLKDKLGNWSNASSEVEFHGAWAMRVGEEGRGVATILEMVALTRLDCLIGAAAEMRAALVQAAHHVAHRQSFGKRLVEHALMQNVVADLALESEAATALMFRIARAVDGASRDPHEARMARIGTAIGKYWACKRAPAFINEAQECLGGAGYVEETPLPRLYREAPLNSIWEGSGNIQCLDVLRALSREPDTAEALFAELERARGGHPALDAEIEALKQSLSDRDSLELRARHITERAALALQAALLVQAGQREVADAFCESRLAGRHGLVFGTLPAGTPLRPIIARAWAAAG